MRPPLVRPLLLVLLTAACATAPEATPETSAPEPTPQVTPYEQPAVEAVRTRTRTLLQGQAKLVWDAWSGGEPVDLSTSYEGSEELFSKETIALIRKARLESTGAEALALERLELYLGGEAIARLTERATLDLSEARSAATLVVDDLTLPWNHLEALLAAEPSAATRAALAESASKVMPELAALEIKRATALDDAAKSLGWASILDYALRLRSANPESLRAVAESTLTGTEALYQQTMGALAHRELALPLSRVRRADVPRLLRASSTGEWFPASQSIEAALSVPAGLGLALSKQKGVTFETGDEPRRQLRPLCVQAQPGRDVRVSMRPRAGLFELRLALRELSCATASSSLDQSLWELRRFVPSVLGETWASLFESPTRAPVWLSMQGVPEEPRARLVSDGAARRLYALRMDAARLLFALRAPEEDPAQAWKTLASRAAGFEFTDADAQGWPLDQEAYLDGADRLRGALLAEQINRKLMERFSAMWWTSDSAGDVLESLWAPGAAMTLEEVSRRLDLGDLTTDALVTTLSEQLKAQ